MNGTIYLGYIGIYLGTILGTVLLKRKDLGPSNGLLPSRARKECEVDIALFICLDCKQTSILNNILLVCVGLYDSHDTQCSPNAYFACLQSRRVEKLQPLGTRQRTKSRWHIFWADWHDESDLWSLVEFSNNLTSEEVTYKTLGRGLWWRHPSNSPISTPISQRCSGCLP